jgi:hypothetical protein
MFNAILHTTDLVSSIDNADTEQVIHTTKKSLSGLKSGNHYLLLKKN